MEEIIFQILGNDFGFDTLITLAQLAIATVLSIGLYHWATKVVTYYKWKRNTLVTLGTKITTSFDGINEVTGEIYEVTFGRVILKTKKHEVVFSLKQFMQRTWKIHKDK